MLRLIALIWLVALPTLAIAEMAARPGWSVTPTAKTYDDLVQATGDAVTAGGLAVVTQAGPTQAAARRGIEIPGNRVIGAFNNDYAVRILRLSTPAMIEAPIRFYVTEDSDGTATLSYKLPSTVLAPYVDEAGPELADIAAELDAAFAEIAAIATAD